MVTVRRGLQHGASLGLGLAAMGTANEEIYEARARTDMRIHMRARTRARAHPIHMRANARTHPTHMHTPARTHSHTHHMHTHTHAHKCRTCAAWSTPTRPWRARPQVAKACYSPHRTVALPQRTVAVLAHGPSGMHAHLSLRMCTPFGALAT